MVWKEKRKLFIWAKFVPARLSVPPGNLPLSNWEQPRVPYPLASDEVHLSVREACNQRTGLSSRHCVRLSVQQVA